MKKNIKNLSFVTFVVCLIVTDSYSAVLIHGQSTSTTAWNDKGSSENGSGNSYVSVSWNEYSATAWQNTTISGNTIYANGGTVESVPQLHLYSEWVSQSAGSLLEIELYVSKPQYFLLDLSVDASIDWSGFLWNPPPYLQIGLIGDNGSIFNFNFLDAWMEDGTSMFYWNEQFSESYLLDSGTYTLTAQTGVEGSYGSDEYYGPIYGGGSWASYNLEFVAETIFIPEPASFLFLGFGGWVLRRRVRK